MRRKWCSATCCSCCALPGSTLALPLTGPPSLTPTPALASTRGAFESWAWLAGEGRTLSGVVIAGAVCVASFCGEDRGDREDDDCFSGEETREAEDAFILLPGVTKAGTRLSGEKNPLLEVRTRRSCEKRERRRKGARGSHARSVCARAVSQAWYRARLRAWIHPLCAPYI